MFSSVSCAFVALAPTSGQAGGFARKCLEAGADLGVLLLAGRGAAQLARAEDHLTDRTEEAIERVGAHAHRRGEGPAVGVGRLRCNGPLLDARPGHRRQGLPAVSPVALP